MIWRTIPGFSRYQASDCGQIRRDPTVLPKYKTVKQRKQWRRGLYLTVVLFDDEGRKRTRPVHVLVALAWHGPRPTPAHHVGHKDNDHMNNRKANLEYVTPSENYIQVLLSGNGANTILTPERVARYRELIAAGKLHIGKTAKRIGISERALIKACNGGSWAFVDAD